jgi:uncharacterized protein (UPF0264 family)
VTRLLVSVRSADEARLALAGGADLIDVKEPQAGSLGAASSQVWREVAEAVAGARPLSAALGELRDFQANDLNPLGDYQYAKLGLAGCLGLPDWINRWQAALSKLPHSVVPVAVAYADHRPAEAPALLDVVNVGHQLGCRALLVDTYHKTSGDVFDVVERAELHEAVRAARQLGMTFVLAGSLRLERLQDALSLEPDFLAVRGAVCPGNRENALDEPLVRIWAHRLSAKSSASRGRDD